MKNKETFALLFLVLIFEICCESQFENAKTKIENAKKELKEYIKRVELLQNYIKNLEKIKEINSKIVANKQPGFTTTCYKTLTRGSDYIGKVSTTQSDTNCQKWSVDSPHVVSTNARKESYFPDASINEASNYCRNPDDSSKPWCYTTNSKVKWEYCEIPKCEKTNARKKPIVRDTCYYENTKGIDYNGLISHTKSGIKCQKWSEIKPHVPNDKSKEDKNYPDFSVKDAQNYCRNPDSSEPRPWCYTSDANVKWELCNIPKCKASTQNRATCYREISRGVNYKGNATKTEYGITCQKWTSNTPHRPYGEFIDVKRFPDKTVEEAQNYCRNPDVTAKPWCYTMNPKIRWQYCNVPEC